jgi:hypothetical protein
LHEVGAEESDIHPGVAGGGAVDVGLVNDEEDLMRTKKKRISISEHTFGRNDAHK